MTPTPDTNLVNARGRKYCTLKERNRFLAAIRAHANSRPAQIQCDWAHILCDGLTLLRLGCAP